MSRKFLIINKLFLSMFVMAIFLGLGFVKGQYSSVSDPAQCSAIPDNSTDSNGGISYTTNLSNPYPWYINDTQAIVLASQYDGTPNVCDGKFNYEASNIERIPWKQNLCNTQINTLISHQNNLFDEFNTVKQDNEYEIGFDDYKGVWNLQSLMSKANCQGHTDCKLGVVTTSNFLFCNVCSAINPEWTELDNYNTPEEDRCEGGKILTENKLCCQPQTQCIKPTIKINGESGKTTYNDEDDVLNVEIDFSENPSEVFERRNDFVHIDVVGGSMVAQVATEATRIIGFRIDRPFEEQIKITVPEDKLKIIGGYICPGAEATLEKVALCPDDTIFDVSNNIGCCVPKDQRDQGVCLNDDLLREDYGLDGENVDLSVLSTDECIHRDDGIVYPFCTCDIIPENGECPDGLVNEDGCCVECPEGKIVVDGKCVCDPSKTCSKSGYVVDPDTCKCKCDPTKTCCGIELNTVVPFIGDCIEMTSQNDTADYNDPNTSRVNQLNAFPFLMMGLSKILVTVILIFSFLIVISAGLLMTTGALDGKGNQYSKGVDMIKKVVVGLILLGSSGLILRLINPNFFGG